MIELLLELAILYAALAYYLTGSTILSRQRKLAITVFAMLMGALQVFNTFGPPPHPLDCSLSPGWCFTYC